MHHLPYILMKVHKLVKLPCWRHTGVIWDKCTRVVDQDFAKTLPSLDLLLLQSLSTPFMITFHKNTDDDNNSKMFKVISMLWICSKMKRPLPSWRTQPRHLSAGIKFHWMHILVSNQMLFWFQIKFDWIASFGFQIKFHWMYILVSS